MSTIEHLGGLSMRFGFLYIAAGVWSLLTHILNMYPMVYKSQVFPGNAGNLRSNMQLYKVNFVDKQQLPYVVMEEDGEIGEYNRANRALHHFIEYSPGVVPCVVLAGVIFPFVVMVLTIIYGIARVWYQIAYAEGGY